MSLLDDDQCRLCYHTHKRTTRNGMCAEICEDPGPDDEPVLSVCGCDEYVDLEAQSRIVVRTDTRSRHVPCDGPVAGMDVCADDNAPWPCDAIREADRAEKAEAALAECQKNAASFLEWAHLRYGDLTADVDAARADAKALAEALRTVATEYKKAVAYTNVTGEDWVMADG